MLADYYVDEICAEIELAESRLIGYTLTIEQAAKISEAIHSLAQTMMRSVPPDQRNQDTVVEAMLLVGDKYKKL